MHNNDIAMFERESQKFDVFKHFNLRIEEMKEHSEHGTTVAKKWDEVMTETLTKEDYPVVHPIEEETFSLFAKYPTGIYEYAFHIDSATSLIEEKNIKSVTFSPKNIVHAIDLGNINTDPKQKRPNHKNPVMVVQSRHLTDNKMYAINGNHRINEAYRNNDESIEVYVFKDQDFIPFFYDYLSKVSYFFEIDYTNIIFGESVFLENKQEAFVYKL